MSPNHQFPIGENQVHLWYHKIALVAGNFVRINVARITERVVCQTEFAKFQKGIKLEGAFYGGTGNGGVSHKVATGRIRNPLGPVAHEIQGILQDKDLFSPAGLVAQGKFTPVLHRLLLNEGVVGIVVGGFIVIRSVVIGQRSNIYPVLVGTQVVNLLVLHENRVAFAVGRTGTQFKNGAYLTGQLIVGVAAAIATAGGKEKQARDCHAPKGARNDMVFPPCVAPG